MPPNQPKKVPKKNFKNWSDIFEIHQTGVRSYRIRPHSCEWVVYCRCMNDEMVIFDEVFCGYMYDFNRTSVGAYRIRPPWRGICSHSAKWVTIHRQFTPYSRTSGRMRYAPTPVRLKSNKYTTKTSSHSPTSGRMPLRHTVIRLVSNEYDQILKCFLGTLFGWLGGMMYFCRRVPRSMTDGRGLTVFG